MSATGSLFVISAPSGAGKSTLVARLMAVDPGVLFSVSWTTRPPRAGETDGVDYHFTDETSFMERIERGDLLEWARVHGHLYGTGRAETERALAAGCDLLLDIDVQGAANVRRSGLPSTSVFVLPPSYDALVARLTRRNTENDETLARRLRAAAKEVRDAPLFDYVIVNDDLEQAAADLLAIVRASRRRRDACADHVRAILDTFPAPADGAR